MSEPKVRMLGGMVLIKVIDAVNTKTASGIEVVQSSNTMSSRVGNVVAIGNGKISDEGYVHLPEVGVGDQVMFMYGEDVIVGGETYCVVPESDIKMVLEK